MKARSGPAPWPAITLDQLPYWMGQFGFQGLGYGPTLIQTMQSNRETISQDFTGFINGAYKSNGAIFAVMLTRMMLFSEARFQFRRMNNGRPGVLFGTKDLSLLETPWPTGVTGDLLAKAIADVDLAGNFFAVRVPDRTQGARVARLRPDWITILKGSQEDMNLNQWDPTAELLGYIYTPGGPGSGLPIHTYLPEEVCHWAPIPDPMATYRGMSWIQPILQEIMADRTMLAHKQMFFEQGATPNLVVTMETGKMDRRTFQEWIDMFEAEHSGALNAYKTLYLGQGADAKVVGANLKELDYAVVQGHGETRIAAAGRVPAIVVGFSEGLESATYSNYAQARRAFADGCLRPLWRNFCGSAAALVNVPPGSALWYDDRDISFLQEDQADLANIQVAKANAILQLVNSGYDPDSVVSAIEANDFSQLKHTGLTSVQLLPPGSQKPQLPPASPDSNGNGSSSDNVVTNGNGSDSTKSSDRAILPLDAEQLAKALDAATAGPKP